MFGTKKCLCDVVIMHCQFKTYGNIEPELFYIADFSGRYIILCAFLHPGHLF